MDNTPFEDAEVTVGQQSDQIEDEFDRNIAVPDVLEFFITLRSAGPDELSALCESLDLDSSISVDSLITLIKSFAETKRNSFGDSLNAGDIPTSDESFLNTSSQLEGCGGDISTMSITEHDVGELLLRNKNLISVNAGLKREVSDVRRQLELGDEEYDLQKQRIAALEKDLRRIQDVKPGIQELLSEKDEIQTANHILQKAVESASYREKVAKEEADDYRVTLSEIQNKYDIVCTQLEKERDMCGNLQTDYQILQDKFEDTHLRWETERVACALKTKQVADLEDRLNHFESMYETINEEKKRLIEQLHAQQLEYSMTRSLNDSSTVKESIEQELTTADENLERNCYDSPICGTATRRTGNFDSPIVRAHKNKLPAFSFLAASSPRKILFDNENRVPFNGDAPFDVCEAETQAVSASDKNPGKTLECEAEMQTVSVEMRESDTQTGDLAFYDMNGTELHECESETQTVSVEMRDSESQTIDCMLYLAAYSAKCEEVEKLEEKLSGMDEAVELAQAEVRQLQCDNRSLKTSLETKKLVIEAWEDELQQLYEKWNLAQDELAQLSRRQAEFVKLKNGAEAELARLHVKSTFWRHFDRFYKRTHWWISPAEPEKQQSQNHSLNAECEEEKCDAAYWRNLAEKSIRTTDALRSDLLKEQEKVLHLSGITAKQLCSGQLDTWWSNRFDQFDSLKSVCRVDAESKIAISLKSQSRLVESLCLMSSHGTSFDQFHRGNVQDFEKIRGVLQAIKEPGRDSREAVKMWESALSLSFKLRDAEKCVGAAGQESKSRDLVKTLTNKSESWEKKCADAKWKLRQIFFIATKCSCSARGKILDVIGGGGFQRELDSEHSADSTDDSPVCADPVPVCNLCERGGVMRLFDLFGAGCLGLLSPSKFRLMIVAFVVCMLLSIRLPDYAVPSVV